MWRNYKKLDCIETRNGLALLCNIPKSAYNMTWHEGKLYFITTDGFLHAYLPDGTVELEKLYVGENAILFVFNGNLYAKGSVRYVNVTDNCDVTPYVPTTRIGARAVLEDDPPSSGGTKHEDVNLLSPYRINTFLPDDENLGYVLWLDSQNIDTDFLPEVTVDGVAVADFQVDYEKGKILLAEVPPEPATEGQDNISVKFKKTTEGYKESILNCTIATEFDNRVFFSGNPEYPSTLWHSSLNDPTYCSDLDYYVDGVDDAPIRGMVAGNNGLWVFKDEVGVNSGVFYHNPTMDSTYGKVYPSTHSSISLGCQGRAINFGDDIVFFSSRGMEGISTDITTEQFAKHRSSLVDRKMLTNPHYKDMCLAEWGGYLLVFIGNEVYLADSRAVTQIENQVEYEWFYWNLGENEVTCATVHEGVLYVASKGSEGEGYLHKLTRDTGDEWEEVVDVVSYWTTPKDNFGSPNKQKTTNKKGCVVEALGDVSVYVKTDKDEEFALANEQENIDDYIVSIIKKKKWKDIQLMFQSKTRFSLDAASLEAFIGSYIKR